MKILVLCEQYSSPGDVYRMAWAHTRNKEYQSNGHDVHVLNFNANASYVYDGITVRTKKEMGYDLSGYDLVLSHAPNIRNHFPYLLRAKFEKIVFFFHGHEVLYSYLDYPKPYFYKRTSWPKRLAKTAYDFTKIKLIKFLIHGLLKDKSHLIFVSDWMRQQYENNLHVILSGGMYSVIPNPVWHDFVEKSYLKNNTGVKLKVLTLRKLDESKYAVDVVLAVARCNPDADFYVYGKGVFFDYFEKPQNVYHTPQMVEQKDLAEFFNGFDIGLLPTRYDAQGVLACEMATYGMPVISSNIAVVKEMLGDFPNVALIDNDSPDNVDITDLYGRLLVNGEKNLKFSPTVTVGQEMAVFEKVTMS